MQASRPLIVLDSFRFFSGSILRTRSFSRVLMLAFFFALAFKPFDAKSQAKPANQQTIPLTRILLIFDCSNSMFGLWESDSKYNIARRLVSKMVDSLDRQQNVELALRCYGHQKKYPPQDCDDTNLEVPFSKGNAWLIKAKLDKLKPSGTTPIALSLEACAKDFPDKNARNVVLLITDGKEECGGDPCAISAALQSKGITLRPFIVGVGQLDPAIRESFNCIGNYYDASTENAFNTILNIIVTQVLNATTAQVNLLDKSGKPSETDVAMTFYDQNTGQQKYNLVHTMNNRGVPDTLRPDPLSTYKLVVHTLPPVEKKDIKLISGKHNVIAVDAPQGFLKVQSGDGSFNKEIQCIIRRAGDSKTLDVMAIREMRKLITGKYDLEILTLPRTYVSGVDISQSHTTTVKFDEPGVVNFQTITNGITSILKEDAGQLVWVCNLSEFDQQESLKLQPGKYKAVFRAKGVKETLFTIQTSFQVQPGTSQKVIIK